MSETMVRRRALALLGGSGIAWATWRRGAHAAVPAVGADGFVQALTSRVLDILRDPGLSSEERLGRVDREVSAAFALERIARITLGRYWKTATPAERAEFAALFKSSVLATYSRRLGELQGRRLRVAGSQPSGDQVSVESYLEGGGVPVRLDWRLTPADDGWQVLDVVIEGVSLVVTYRNEFATVIEQGGGRVSVLIGALRARSQAKDQRSA